MNAQPVSAVAALCLLLLLGACIYYLLFRSPLLPNSAMSNAEIRRGCNDSAVALILLLLALLIVGAALAGDLAS